MAIYLTLERRKLHSSDSTSGFHNYFEGRYVILLRGIQITLLLKLKVLTKISKKTQTFNSLEKLLVGISGIYRKFRLGSNRRSTHLDLWWWPSQKFQFLNKSFDWEVTRRSKPSRKFWPRIGNSDVVLTEDLEDLSLGWMELSKVLIPYQ